MAAIDDIPVFTLSHSFFLLEDAYPYSCGALMQPDIYDSGYEGHSHLWDVYGTVINAKVTSLTKEECDLLDAIGSYGKNADRYTVYNTPGKLEWGLRLKVGKAVLARLPGGDSSTAQYIAAIIRAIGVDHTWCERKLFGLEITVSLHSCYIILYTCSFIIIAHLSM